MKTLKEAKLVNTLHDGVKLLGKGSSTFRAPIDIEVSAASQGAIHAVEKAGGRIVCSYYNRLGLQVLCKPDKWIARGLPLPRKARPPPKRIDYYTDFKNRGRSNYGIVCVYFSLMCLPSFSPVSIGYLSPEMQLIDQGVVSKDTVIKNHELLMPAL